MIVLDAERHGGGVLRAAIACVLATGTPCAVERLRATRPQPGLQLVHQALLHATAPLLNADVGRDSIVLEATGTSVDSLELDLDDTTSTITLESVCARVCDSTRETEYLTDTHGPPAARGHSCITPLVSMLPALVDGRLGRVRAFGGTIMAGAPFAEEFAAATLSAAARVNAPLTLDIRSHGLLGTGGGEVELGAASSLPAPVARPTLLSYGRDLQGAESIGRHLRAGLGVDVDVHHVPLPSTHSGQLLLIPAEHGPRCARVSPEEHLEVPGPAASALLDRARRERSLRGLTSPFVLDQVLPLCLAEDAARTTWRTESLPAHLVAVLEVLDAFAPGRVETTGRPGRFQVTVTQ